MAEKAVQAEQSIQKENKMGTMPVNNYYYLWRYR